MTNIPDANRLPRQQRRTNQFRSHDDIIRLPRRLAATEPRGFGLEDERLVGGIRAVQMDSFFDVDDCWLARAAGFAVAIEWYVCYVDDALGVGNELGPCFEPGGGGGDAPVVRVTEGELRVRECDKV
jgi:hypothetical protein